MNKYKIAGTDLVRKTAHVYTHAVIAVSPSGVVSARSYCGSYALGLDRLAAIISEQTRYSRFKGYKFELREVTKI